MGSGEQIVPERLIQLANTLDDTVGHELDLAKAYFEQAEIAGEKFSQAGIAMQLAYPGIRQWAMADSQSKREDLKAITDKLATTATTWANAERGATIDISV